MIAYNLEDIAHLLFWTTKVDCCPIPIKGDLHFLDCIDYIWDMKMCKKTKTQAS